jgi:hypothetical protein
VISALEAVGKARDLETKRSERTDHTILILRPCRLTLYRRIEGLPVHGTSERTANPPAMARQCIPRNGLFNEKEPCPLVDDGRPGAASRLFGRASCAKPQRAGSG